MNTKNLTNTERRIAIKKVENLMAAQILKETSAAVEITSIGVNKWSVCGTAEAVDAAVTWMVGTGTTVENERIHDDEIGETFSYITTHA